jgi:hypothetical protein
VDRWFPPRNVKGVYAPERTAAAIQPHDHFGPNIEQAGHQHEVVRRGEPSPTAAFGMLFTPHDNPPLGAIGVQQRTQGRESSNSVEGIWLWRRPTAGEAVHSKPVPLAFVIPRRAVKVAASANSPRKTRR